MYKFVVLSCLLAVAAAGYAPLAPYATYAAAAPVVAHAPVLAHAPLATSYQNTYRTVNKPLAYAAPYVAHAAPAVVAHAAPAVVASHAPLYRSYAPALSYAAPAYSGYYGGLGYSGLGYNGLGYSTLIH